jgi:hypothetical protein
MNKEIDLIFQGVPYHGQKILKNGIRPAFAASGMTLKTLRNFISEMGIGRVDELQKNLQNLIVLTHRGISMPGRVRLVSKRVPKKSSKGIRFRVALLIVFLSLHLLEEAPCGSTGYSLNPWIGDWN